MTEYYRLIHTKNLLDLGKLYSDHSTMSNSGVGDALGSENIIEMISPMVKQGVTHKMENVNYQPTADGGVLVNCIGKIKVGDDPLYSFSQAFVINSDGDNAFFIQYDVFQLVYCD